MKQFYLFFPLLIFATFCHAQQFSVKSFRALPNDLDARASYPKEDKNGEKAALVKIVTTETGFEFDGGMIGIVAVVPKTSEIWLYVPRGSKVVTIMHPKLGQLRNFPYPIPLEAGNVYEMVLTTGRVETIIVPPVIETQWLLISTEPIAADVYINDQPAGKTPYQNELPTGKYTWRVSKELYLNEAGVANLIAGGEKQVMNLKMKPNFGTLNISTTPENGATVSLNEIGTGKITPCSIEKVPTGDHSITLSRDMYETTTQRVSLAAGENQPVAVIMNPTFAEVSVTTEPAADIYINGQMKSNATWNGRLNPGVYTFEARLEKHSTAIEKQTVIVGQPLTVKLTPTPKTGNLRIMTTPFEATIIINGKEMGKTPITLKNQLIGEYTVELSLAGYAVSVEKATVVEGKTMDVTIMLRREVKSVRSDSTEASYNLWKSRQQLVINTVITSNPSGANLFIDDKPAGKTPYQGNLFIGSHKLRIEKDGIKIEKIAEVKEGGETSFSLELQTFKIGQKYGGGIIFYIDETGKHGLIAAPNDQSVSAKWGCYGTTGGTSTAIGTGQANTLAIVNKCSEGGIAARICNDLVLNGYSDWFLPSKDELNQMYLKINVLGGLIFRWYWSSSEYNAGYAWGQLFGDGNRSADYKNTTYFVRAVRAF